MSVPRGVTQISLFTECEVRFIRIQKNNFWRLSISFLNRLIRHLCCIFLRFRHTNLSFSNFILREFAHFITCDIYIKKQSVIAHVIPNTRLSHPCLQSVYENAGNAHADICFYNNMFTVTQVFKSDRFSIYCSVNVPFSKRSIEIDLALSNVNANRSLLDRFR
jgi:hypothetical protein